MVRSGRSLWLGDGQNDVAQRPRDIEAAGSRKGDPRSKFRDAVQDIIGDSRRVKMKKTLLDGISRYDLEHYRKSPEEVLPSWS